MMYLPFVHDRTNEAWLLAKRVFGNDAYIAMCEILVWNLYMRLSDDRPS